MPPVHGLVAAPARADKVRFAAGLGGLAAMSAVAWLMLWAAIVPNLIGWSSVAVTSGSMEPRIATGDVVIMADTDGRDLTAGTVIVFDNPASSGLLTHRIIEVAPDGGYITRGDANGRSDSTPVAPDDVKGVGRMVIPEVGHPIVWAQEGQWVLLLFLLIAGAAAAWTSRWAMMPKSDPWRTPSIVPEIPRRTRRRVPQVLSSITVVLLAGLLIAATTTLSRASFVSAAANSGSTVTADVLQPPSLVSASGGGTVELSWTITPDTYAAGHRIYRSTSSGGPYTQVGQTAPRATAAFTDSPPDGTYFYVVRAFTTNWESVSSNEVVETVAPVALAGSWQGGLTHATPSGTDRVMIIVATNEQQTSSSPWLTAVSYGGQPLVPIIVEEITSGNVTVRTEAWILGDAGIVAAVGTTISPTWSSAPDTALYFHAFFQNVDQTTRVGATATATGASTPNPVPVGPVMTTNNDMVISVAAAGVVGSYTAQNGFTLGLSQSTNTGGSTTGGTAHKVANGSDETGSLLFSGNPLRQAALAFVLNVAP